MSCCPSSVDLTFMSCFCDHFATHSVYRLSLGGGLRVFLLAKKQKQILTLADKLWRNSEWSNHGDSRNKGPTRRWNSDVPFDFLVRRQKDKERRSRLSLFLTKSGSHENVSPHKKTVPSKWVCWPELLIKIQLPAFSWESLCDTPCQYISFFPLLLFLLPSVSPESALQWSNSFEELLKHSGQLVAPELLSKPVKSAVQNSFLPPMYFFFLSVLASIWIVNWQAVPRGAQ